MRNLKSLSIAVSLLLSIPIVQAQRSESEFMKSAYVAASAGNYAQAVEDAKKAADAGDSRAYDYLGRVYRDGKGVQKNAEQSVFWFSQAVSQGLVDSMLLITTVKGCRKIKIER